MNGSLKIYWVICNYPQPVTLNHSLIQVITYLKFPCMPIDLDSELCTTCNGWGDNVQPFLVYISLLSSSSSVSAARSRQTSTGRLWLPLELRVSTCPPLGQCLPASVPPEKANARERRRRAGEPAESWWAPTRRGLGGKAEAGTWALHTEMRWLTAPWSGSFVHSAASVWKRCG